MALLGARTGLSMVFVSRSGALEGSAATTPSKSGAGTGLAPRSYTSGGVSPGGAAYRGGSVRPLWYSG